MNLKQWCDVDERLYIAESDERYKQYAGLDYSEQLIQKLAEMKLRNAQIFLSSFSEPKEIILSALENIADAKTKKLELKLHNVRNKRIASTKHQIGNSPVNWSTWRQFNSIQNDPTIRKKVFDEFITKTKYIAPIIENRFKCIKEVYDEFGSSIKINTSIDENPIRKDRIKDRPNRTKVLKNPLDGYLEAEKISYMQLINFVRSLGSIAKRPFRNLLEDISTKVLKRNAEYYDDFYYFRNKVYSDFEKNFSRIDPLKQVSRTLDKMRFDRSKIFFDVEDRINKYPSPICFFIQIPNDIRVLYKSESPYFDLQACFHETGHAIHASSIEPSLEYWSRYNFPMGIAEIFSIFLERLTKNRLYLKSQLGISDERLLDEITERNRFMELFFLTFYTANSLMKAEFWYKNLSLDHATSLYSKLITDYTGLEVPGEYWMLHHILPESIMYVPSYLIAAVRALELEIYLKNKFGEKWWSEDKSGDIIRQIMRPGAEIELSRFSKLDSKLYIDEILNS